MTTSGTPRSTPDAPPPSAVQVPRQGPLAGTRIVEFVGMGPAPFACMLLADMGADVARIDRPGVRVGDPLALTARGRETVLLNLKDTACVDAALSLLDHADVMVEGFRPGVMERLGLGPDTVLARNPALVYARMTGWGQSGPLAQAAGHDINYIAAAGALAPIGPAGGLPAVPLNLVGDFGGGGTYLVMGILAALLEARRSGKGQVVDAAICDGVISLMTSNASQTLRGSYREERGTNVLDGGAPYYGVYQAGDGLPVAVGAIEPQFFALLCERLGVDPALRDAQHDRSRWPALRQAIAACMRTRTRDEWCGLLEDSDACFAPVLHLSETAGHAHMRARGSFVTLDGVRQPAPAPRFSRTPSRARPALQQPVLPQDILQRWQSADKAADS